MKNTTLLLTLVLAVLCAPGAFAQPAALTQGDWLRSLELTAEPARIPPPAEPEPLPAAPAQKAARSLPGDYDAQKAALLASAALNNNLGYFAGRCYEFVANHMERAGVIRPSQWDELGIGPDHAADFAAWANANPAAMRAGLSLEKMETPEKVADLPLGGIVVYERGACGFSKRSGHIEVVVAENQLCSDGCESFEAACLEDPAVRSRIHVYVPVKAPR